MTFWLHRFRKLDVRQKSHRKMLIDTFINAIFLYDDKMVIAFNYKEGTTTITFDDLKTALTDQKIGSDLDCLGSPRKQLQSCFFFCVLSQKTVIFDQIYDHISHFRHCLLLLSNFLVFLKNALGDDLQPVATQFYGLQVVKW